MGTEQAVRCCTVVVDSRWAVTIALSTFLGRHRWWVLAGTLRAVRDGRSTAPRHEAFASESYTFTGAQLSTGWDRTAVISHQVVESAVASRQTSTLDQGARESRDTCIAALELGMCQLCLIKMTL